MKDQRDIACGRCGKLLISDELKSHKCILKQEVEYKSEYKFGYKSGMLNESDKENILRKFEEKERLSKLPKNE